jgi:hypothetical protein
MSPSWLSPIHVALVFIGAILAGILLPRLQFRSASRPGPEKVIKSKDHWNFWLEVPLILFAGVLILTLVSILLGFTFDRSTDGWLGDTSKRFFPIILLAPPVASLLVLRWIRSDTFGVWAAGIIFFGGTALIFHSRRMDFLRLVFDDLGGVPTYYAGSYFIPSVSMAALYLGVLPALVLCGLATYSFHRRWYSFVFGGIMIPLIAALILEGLFLHFQSSNSVTQVYTLFSPLPGNSQLTSGQKWMVLLLHSGAAIAALAAIWSPRRLREGLLRAAGMLDIVQNNPNTRSLGAMGRYLFVGLTFLHIALVFGALQLTAAFIKHFNNGPQILPRSPRLVNAWDALSSRFTRKRGKLSPREDISGLLELSQKALIPFPAPASFLSTRDAVSSSAIRTEITLAGKRIAPWVEDFTRAGDADYLSPQDGKRYVLPSFLHIREVARWLSLHSQMAMVDGDWKKALEPIHTLYQYSGLEVDTGLLTHMAQQAVKHYANQTATLYWQAFWDNQEAMDGLAKVLESTAPGNRRSFPWDNIRRHESGHLPVVVYADLSVLPYARAVRDYELMATSWDRVAIATASARMRNESGAWPKSSKDLSPKYLPAMMARSPKTAEYSISVKPDQLLVRLPSDTTTATQSSKFPPPQFLFQSTSAKP